MRTFRLDRTFDAVLMDDGYLFHRHMEECSSRNGFRGTRGTIQSGRG
jgi:hypothetical protein